MSEIGEPLTTTSGSIDLDTRWCFTKTYRPQQSVSALSATCRDSVVYASAISSQCAMQNEQANSSLSSPNIGQLNYTNPTVHATADNTVTIVSGPTISQYSTSTQIIGSLTFQTNLGGKIYWTYTVVCSGVPITRTGTQTISCPGP